MKAKVKTKAVSFIQYLLEIKSYIYEHHPTNYLYEYELLKNKHKLLKRRNKWKKLMKNQT